MTPINPQTIRSAPKVVLHDHLDGGLRPSSVLELADQVGHELPAGDEADQLFNGQRIRVLTIVDIFSKVGSASGVGFTYRNHDVVAILEQAVKQHGCPKRVRVDSGPEIASRDF